MIIYMKKIFSILFGSAFVIASFTSCSNEEADIWDESSIERLEDVQKSYAEILTSAENGWEMQYFPTVSSAGYIINVKFSADGSVVTAMKNQWTDNQYKESEPSLWSVNIDNGPVLSFNSYNSLLHIFSDPKEIPGTSYGNGLGMEGDYEFIMIDMPTDENGVVTLKGKKRGTYAYLTRIPAGENWEERINVAYDMRQTMLVNNPSPLALSVNGKEYNMWYQKADDQINIVAVGGDTITQQKLYHYVFNSRGLFLLEPFELDEAAGYQWFEADIDAGQSWLDMNRMEGKDFIGGETIEGVSIAAGRPLWFFNQQLSPAYDNSPSSVGTLSFDLSKDANGNYTSMSSSMGEAFESVTSKIAEVIESTGLALGNVKYDLIGAYDAANENENGYSLMTTVTLSDNVTSFWIKYFFSHTENDNSVTLAYNNTYRCSDSRFQAIADAFLASGSAEFGNLLSLLGRELSVDFDKTTTLRTVRVSDVQNSDLWFLVKSNYYRR